MSHGTPFGKLNGLNWTADDLVKKFSGAYVLATSPNTEEPTVFLIEHPSEGGKVMARAAAVKPVWYSHKDFKVVDDRPPICTTNLGNDHALVFRYNPERQWRRGVGMYNCFFYRSPSLNLGVGKDIGFEIAEAVFKPKYSTLEEALQEFRDSKTVTGRAIKGRGSAQYMMCRETPTSAISLYRDRTLMGSFTGSKFFTMQEAGRLFSAEIEKELPNLRDKYAFTRRAA